MHRAWPFVRLSVCLSPKYKYAIFSKTKQFRAIVHGLYLRPTGSRTRPFQRTHYWTHKIPDGLDPPSWKSTWRHFFSAEAGRIWIKFRRLVQNDMSTAVIWSKSKLDVEFQYGGRLGELHGMSPQSHLPHCRVLPPREFNNMSSQSHVSHATWWIHCHDFRATCHIARCSHLAKSMSLSCHIAGCNNSIRHIENRFRHILFFFWFFKMQFDF